MMHNTDTIIGSLGSKIYNFIYIQSGSAIRDLGCSLEDFINTLLQCLIRMQCANAVYYNILANF